MNWILPWWLVGIALILVTIGHELGHMVAATLLGIPVKRIAVGLGPTLWRGCWRGRVEFVLRAMPAGMSVGVPSRWDETGKLRRPVAHDMAVAAAGPAASMLITAVMLGLALLWQPQGVALAWLFGVAALSAVLGLLNLIPVPGLDGGHLLILGASWLGWTLSPVQEAAIHRTGLHVMALLCLVLFAVEIAQRLSA